MLWKQQPFCDKTWAKTWVQTRFKQETTLGLLTLGFASCFSASEYPFRNLEKLDLKEGSDAERPRSWTKTLPTSTQTSNTSMLQRNLKAKDQAKIEFKDVQRERIRKDCKSLEIPAASGTKAQTELIAS